MGSRRRRGSALINSGFGRTFLRRNAYLDPALTFVGDAPGWSPQASAFAGRFGGLAVALAEAVSLREPERTPPTEVSSGFSGCGR
jgi:hypothetical protein